MSQIMLVGIIEADPVYQPMQTTRGFPTYIMPLAAQGGQVFPLVVRSRHGQWVASTINAGRLVQATGTLTGHVIDAWRVRQVRPVEGPVE